MWILSFNSHGLIMGLKLPICLYLHRTKSYFLISIVFSNMLSWIDVWNMCQYFVLLSRNLSEYSVVLNTSYLQNPVTQLQLCHKFHSRICFLPLIFSNFPSLYLLAIAVSHFYPRLGEVARRLILRIQPVKNKLHMCNGTISHIH